MKIRNLVSGVVVVVLSLQIAALKAQTVISGKVLDSETKAPLAGAVLLQSGQEKGAVTDSTGAFRLAIFGTHPSIRIQYLGYKPLVKRLESNDQLRLVWELEPDGLSLPTTTITDTKLQRVYPDQKVMVVDYEFLEENILMIIFDKLRKRNVLQLFSPDLQVLAEYDDPFDPPAALLKDCLGARHCLSDHFAGQIDYVGATRLIVRKDSLENFQKIVAPCLASLDSTYFFAFMPHPYAKGFTYVHGSSHASKSLYNSIDTEALKKVRDEKMMTARTASNQIVDITTASASHKASRAGFQAGLNEQYLTKIAFPPIYVPIQIVQSTACIFDHPHLQLLRFDSEGKEVGRVEIAYPTLRNWKKEVIANEEQTAAFTLTEANGYLTVHRIDLQSGELVENWELPFQFVQKIKIKGRHIYFTYRDSQYDPIKRLYRLEM